MKDTWWSPGQIRFTHRQTLWLIRQLEVLRDGRWPPEASNYIDLPGKKSGHKAPSQTPIEYAAEITDRLERCGIDGLILLAIECWGMSIASLVKYFKMPEFSILKRRKSALGFVSSGPARRWLSTKKRKGETYEQFKLRKRTAKAK